MKKYTAALQLFGKNHLASKLAHTCISAFGSPTFSLQERIPSKVAFSFANKRVQSYLPQ